MTLDYLDLFTTALGLLYIWLEYRAHIALWVVGIIMPALDVYLYYSHGLYGDAGMAVYYTLAAIYGYVVWKMKEYKARNAIASTATASTSADSTATTASSADSTATVASSADSTATTASSAAKTTTTASTSISHMPLRLYLPVAACFFLAWGATYYILIRWTNSTVPLLDSFSNALSFVGLWALARKYVEQWFFWMVVDVVCTILYVHKGIPFKAGLYGLYVVIAILGYFKWLRLMAADKARASA